MKNFKVHYFQHVNFEGLGCIEDWAKQRGFSLSTSRFYTDCELPKVDDIDLLIVMGGPMGVYDESVYPWLKPEKQFIRQMIDAEKPVLGICLGAQLLASVLGARIFPNKQKEIGWFDIALTEDGVKSKILEDFDLMFPVFHWHGDTFDIPDGAKHLIKSEACENQSFLYNEKVLALQFHLEVTAESLNMMVENCGNELKIAPFVQSADVILQSDQYFARNNHRLYLLLDRMVENVKI